MLVCGDVEIPSKFIQNTERFDVFNVKCHSFENLLFFEIYFVEALANDDVKKVQMFADRPVLSSEVLV